MGITLMFSMILAFSLVTQNPLQHTLSQSPIEIERESPRSEIPIDWRMAKVFVPADINGFSGEFMFDTGSPTMLSHDLVSELGLEIIGQNTGRDSHGREITMDVAMVESIRLGDTVFRNVPVMVFDFSQLEDGACFVPLGILGSEILHGSVWSIDIAQRVMTIEGPDSRSSPREFDVSSPLYDFGYPHMPIIDYQIGRINDKALFDTGNAGALVLFDRVADDRSVRRKLVRGSIETGQGFAGVSAGGWAEQAPLFRAMIDDLTVGQTSFDPITVTTRSSAPTLLGASFLRTHVVTLDYPGQQFGMSAHQLPTPVGRNAGYGIALKNDRATIIQLYDDSAADRAGLRLGDVVTAIGERALEIDPETRCEHARWLAEEFEPSERQTLSILRDNEAISLTIPAESLAN